jgi:putative transposase
VEGGKSTLEAMVFVDEMSGSWAAEGAPPEWSSARQHCGFETRLPLVDAPEYWALGNTPFERAGTYRSALEQLLGTELKRALAASVDRGWPTGSNEFLRLLEKQSKHPVAPRPRGRPRKSAPRPTSVAL